MKIVKVYTKTGDKGTTSLVGGVKIRKSSVRIEAYGTVDELSSHLGLLAAHLQEGGRERDRIYSIQNTLFNMCSYLATDTNRTPVCDSAGIREEEVKQLEAEIDTILSELPDKLGFVLPGGTVASAQAHVCRSVCRRAERRIVALSEEADISEEILQYINRLSDYLFVLAKKINFMAGYEEKTWHKSCE